MAGLVHQLKLFVFDRNSYFWKSVLLYLHVISSLRTIESLCLNSQKPLLPSNISGYTPEYHISLEFLRSTFSTYFYMCT